MNIKTPASSTPSFSRLEKPAAIEASLVDVRNIATHKCVRLELHVPAEHAPLVMQAFGWPTMVAPVPVAVARLNGESESGPSSLEYWKDKPVEQIKERRRWDDLKLSMQASIRCGEPAFWKFIHERMPENNPTSSEDAARIVRSFCGVSSKADLLGAAGRRWLQLDDEYQAWLKAPDAP